MKKYYFVGIGGSGMNPLAQILRERGSQVGGSDRSFDRGVNNDLFTKLRSQGIFLFPQDGSSITDDIDFLVVSSAIEADNKEIKQAMMLGVPVIHRTDLLAQLFNGSFGIGIAGTSGKTTVTGMVASILDAAGKDPTVINGGIINQYIADTRIGNAKSGASDIVVIETDESDGSIVKLRPKIGVITNITKDHKEMDELKTLFQTFADNTEEVLIVNTDCNCSEAISAKKKFTFSVEQKSLFKANAIRLEKTGTSFTIQGNAFHIVVPGRHNVYNAAAAIATGVAMDIPVTAIQKGLASFTGIQRRLEIVAVHNGITVIDDFAHNSHKISSSIAALRQFGERLLVVFQPHGYGPTKFLLKELGAAFSASLTASDILFMLPIYDAGGTADRSITSSDLLKEIHGPQAYYLPERSEVIDRIKSVAQPGDVVAVMGARDDTLSWFAQEIVASVV